MALFAGALQKPVSAHGGPMSEYLGVVIHVTAGEGDPYNEFANPANQVSSHFGIGNGQGGMADGLVEQYVDTANESWAQAAGNGSYISVETEGEPTDPLTPAQLASFARVLAWCHETHGVPLAVVDVVGQRGLITHGDGGAAWGGHTGCPGPDRTAQRAAIVAAATPPTPTPVTPAKEALSMFAFDPATGGYWATDANGDVFAGGGAPSIPGLNTHPAWQAGQAESVGANPCVGIVYWASDGVDGLVFFTAPSSGIGGWAGTPYSTYRILRNGTPD